MKRNTPLLTLLTGAALGVILLIVNMVSYPNPAKSPTSYSAPVTSAPAASTAASSPAPAVATSAAASPTPAVTVTVPVAVNFAGKAQKGNAAVAVAIHGDKAIAYICNGPTVAAWFQGTVSNGKVDLAGKGGSHASLTFDTAGTMTGNVSVHDTQFPVSMLPTVHSPAGLYIFTGMVGGKMIKAGWIEMSNGTQIGSILINPGASAPTVIAAPLLNVAAATATYDGTVLHATQISGISGSGF
jgi:serine/threonine-protein kinase